jgi:hypothetical protein
MNAPVAALMHINKLIRYTVIVEFSERPSLCEVFAMPALRRVSLRPDEKSALERVRDTDSRAYVRERAAALLKVADGLKAAQVARERLLRPRQEDTVYAWLDRFENEGMAGLIVRPGRGRKPAFSPGLPDARSGEGSDSARGAP